jgi:hypothetical protein
MFQFKDFFILAAAFMSFVLSVTLWFNGHEPQGQFVGIWVPSILGFGVYVNVVQLRRG